MIAHHIFTRPIRNTDVSTRHPMSAFTVLELIVVIGVLSMLLAIILPLLKSSRTAVMKRQAQIEATTLVQAALRYKAEYGFWPGQLIWKTVDSVALHPDIQDKNAMLNLIAMGPRSFTEKITVRGSGPSNLLFLHTNEVFRAFSTVGRRDGATYQKNPLNPKAIPFLVLRNENDFETVGFADPWGQSYRLIMGLDPRSVFEFKVTRDDAVVYTVPISNVTAFAVSLGSEGEHGTNYIYSAGVQ